jgi:hypothetical protein
VKLFYNLCRVCVFLLLIPVLFCDAIVLCEYGWPFLRGGVKGFDHAVVDRIGYDVALEKEVSPGVYEWRFASRKERYIDFIRGAGLLIFLTTTLFWSVRILNRRIRKLSAHATLPTQTDP